MWESFPGIISSAFTRDVCVCVCVSIFMHYMHLPNSTMVFSHRRPPWLSPSAATTNWRANAHYYSVYQALTGDEIPSGITRRSGALAEESDSKEQTAAEGLECILTSAHLFSALQNTCRAPRAGVFHRIAQWPIADV